MTFYARHLPHWQPPGQDVFITWRLAGSLPADFKPPKSELTSGKTLTYYDRALDAARTGPLWLEDPRVAQTVLSALQQAHQRSLFHLRAYVLMANHVHILLEPQSPLSKITHQLKGSTAHEANRILDRTGTRFWQDESFDHWIRNPEEWQRGRTYIERNPVTAGLVSDPKDWPWSSASRPIEAPQ